MLSHTWLTPCTTLQTVDRCVGELLQVANEVGARFLVTSDHGNADDMVQRDKKGKPLVSAQQAAALCHGPSQKGLT